MAAPKGNDYGKGRPVGSKNKKTLEWEAFSEYVLSEGLTQFRTDYEELSPDKRVDAFLKMLEYFKPKLARTEMKAQIDHIIPTPSPEQAERLRKALDKYANERK